MKAQENMKNPENAVNQIVTKNTSAKSKWQIGQKINHKTFGLGIIVEFHNSCFAVKHERLINGSHIRYYTYNTKALR